MSEKVIVIGSGPGGYRSAVLASEKGFEVTLVERDLIGGVCTNTGCIPSKSLLSAAELIDSIKGAPRKGVDVTLNDIDHNKVMKNKERAVKISRKGVENELKNSGVKLIAGEARLLKDGIVDVDGEQIAADNIIIATGSLPVELPFLKIDEEKVLSNKGALSLQEIPDSMLIIGGGYIGVEMAFIFSSLGTSVTLVELMDVLLPGMDSSLSQEAESMLKRKGVDIMTDAKVTSVEDLTAVISHGDEVSEYRFHKILCSVGRRPNPPDTEYDILAEDGSIITDDHMRTPVEGVYAVGDVTGKGMLAHTAYQQASIVVDTMMGSVKKGFSEYLVPAGVFTHPEIASVGLSEEAAREVYDDVRTAVYNVSALGRGFATGERNGLAKIVSKGDIVIGLHLVCPGATDIIMEGTLAMEKGLTVEEVIDTIHPHPTYCEAIKEAAALIGKN